MYRNDRELASVDAQQYVDGLAKMTLDYIDDGFEGYMTTFMFRSLPNNDNIAKNVMRNEITRVYGRFLTEVVRNPWSKKNRNSRPVLLGCPDWPVPKAKKTSAKIGGTGIHFGSILLIPPFNRLVMGVKDHFERKSVYTRSDYLQRIDTTHVGGDFEKAVGYTFKSLTRRRCTIDDILILPSASTENFMR